MKKYKNLYVKTYGCQMNFYDSQQIVNLLNPLGYNVVNDPENADLAILNTCHIREKAEQKMYSDLGRLNRTKQKKQAAGNDLTLAVGGCVAQAEGKQIITQAPHVSMVFGPQTYHRLPEMLAKLERDKDTTEGPGRGIVVDTDFPVDSKFDELPQAQTTSTSAFLSIQEGCDKFCTYCCVPYTRGAEYSRPISAILDEAKRLVDLGTKEITLLGQNVNAFHGKGNDGKEWGLGHLIFEIAKLDGLDRIRYTTSHPNDVQDDLIAAHRDVEKLMPHLHLPVQSGSDRVLKAMNRKHTADEYRHLMDRFREARPGIAFSSDFIVGFPGETNEEFEQTVKLVEDVKYAQAYSFKYSPRPGTPAAVSKDQIDEDIQSERLYKLQAVLNRQQMDFNKSCEGKTLKVLFEKKGRHEGQIIGKSEFLQSVHVEGSERLLNNIVDVRIKGSQANSLSGEIITKEDSTAA